MSGGGDIQALVNYYARAGYARHIQTVCVEVLRKRAGDPTLQFWRTFGMILEGSYSEAIMQLEGLMGCVHCLHVGAPGLEVGFSVTLSVRLGSRGKR
jgi:hypothetical protein